MLQEPSIIKSFMKNILTAGFLFFAYNIQAQITADVFDTLTVNWNKQSMISKSTATLQVVVNPMLRRGSPIHDQSFTAL